MSDGILQHRGATPPWWRDPWAWLSLLALVPLALHSRGAPLGEPVADDFDHLHYALFSRRYDDFRDHPEWPLAALGR